MVTAIVGKMLQMSTHYDVTVSGVAPENQGDDCVGGVVYTVELRVTFVAMKKAPQQITRSSAQERSANLAFMFLCINKLPRVADSKPTS